MHHDIQLFAEYAVTPFVGVWIETPQFGSESVVNLSHPSWVCGLKLMPLLIARLAKVVTPFVGVWIETRNKQLLDEADKAVTPFVGVWIETE